MRLSTLRLPADAVFTEEKAEWLDDHMPILKTSAYRVSDKNWEKQLYKIVPVFYDWASMHDNLYRLAGQGVPDIADVEMGKWPMFMNGEIQFLDLTPYVQPYAKDLITPILDMVSKVGNSLLRPAMLAQPSCTTTPNCLKPPESTTKPS